MYLEVAWRYSGMHGYLKVFSQLVLFPSEVMFLKAYLLKGYSSHFPSMLLKAQGNLGSFYSRRGANF